MTPTGSGAGRRATNLPRMAEYNRSVVLEAIRRASEGLSRTELAAQTGLSAQAVTNIVRHLLEIGVVVEAGRTVQGPGKPRTMLRLDAASRYAVGVHLDPTVVTLVLLDLAGDVVARSVRRTPGGAPERVVAAIARGVDELIASSQIDSARLCGLGVGTPGPLDAEQGTVVEPPNLPAWHRFPLRDAIADATAVHWGPGAALVLEKDTTAAALAEQWRGVDRAEHSFLMIYVGTGIGAGLARSGQVIRGTSGNAGEMGHIIVDPDGPSCDCGNRGCVAVVCTPRAVVGRAIQRGLLREASAPDLNDPERVDALLTALTAAVADGDAPARDLLEESARLLAVAVSALSNAMDPDRVVLGGPFWARLSPVYLPVLEERLRAGSAAAAVHELQVSEALAGDDTVAVGAACAVLDTIHAPHPETLYLPVPTD